MIYRDTCPICGGAAVSIFSWPFNSLGRACALERLPAELAAGFSSAGFEIKQCANCDFTFQRVAPDEEEILHVYALHADEAAIRSEIANQKLHWFAHMTEEILVLMQLVAARPPRVLDYGCNWGKWASMALAFGCDVEAVEVNPVTAKFCAARGIKIVDPSTLPDRSYHFINVDQVLEHIADPLALALQLAEKLAPGGYMKWSTPHDSALPQALARASLARDPSILDPQRIDALEPLVHLNLFTNQSLRKLGQRAGLDAVTLPFLKWLGAGQLWNVPRQVGRNLSTPRKRWLGQGTYLWFSRKAGAPAGSSAGP